MKKQYDLAVFIARAQPFHNGHLSVINKAKEIADKVLVLVGSANASISAKNPFSYAERVNMIEEVVGTDIRIEALDDYTYEENQWITDVQEAVGTNYKKVCLIGHTKDDSSYYLKNFPQWDLVDVPHFEVINATDIRELMYQGKYTYIKNVVPESIFAQIVWLRNSNKLNDLVEEYKYIKAYKESWAAAPYPPTFITADAVVIQSGHILLVQRKEQPGKGLWAMPGGFLNPNETLLDGCIRELREETRLKIPEPVLRGSIIKAETFDAPNRSQRGRTITRAFLIQLNDSQDLPKVKGSDDALVARWIPLSQFYSMPEQMFEDHYFIIRSLLDNK